MARAVKKAKEERFDHCFAKLIHWRNKSVVSMRRHVCVLRSLRRQAFEIAKLIVQLRSQWINELLSMAKSESKTLDTWIDEHLQVVDVLGESRQKILKDVASGMKLKDYMAKGSSWNLDTNAEKRIKATDSVFRVVPAYDGMSDAELIEYQRTLIQTLKTELAEVRKENAQLRREHTTIVKHIRPLSKSLVG